MPYYMDSGYIIFVLPAIILSLLAQFYVNSTFGKYSKVVSARRITGADAARNILNRSGVYNVNVEHIRGNLNDHFDPRSNVIRLSDAVYNSTSISAIGVAAHEAGHAIQHANGYLPIKLRNLLVPIANISSPLSMVLIMAGLLLNMLNLAYIGVIAFSAVLVFQIVTLPVEFNASGRALRLLTDLGILSDVENKGAKKVLTAAGLTYVAAVAVTLANLLRFLSIINGRKRN